MPIPTTNEYNEFNFQIQYNSERQMVGGRVKSMFFENNRVCFHQPGQAYHIFYALCISAPTHLINLLHLTEFYNFQVNKD